MKPQTYSVVVNEVPVKELLNALARDTRQNIDIHPTVSGLVSLNAIDETLPLEHPRGTVLILRGSRVSSSTPVWLGSSPLSRNEWASAIPYGSSGVRGGARRAGAT